MLMSSPADANALVSDVSALPSAFAAYGHYFGLILSTVCLTAERILISPTMTEKDEDKLIIIDSLYGIAGLLVVATGYLRVTQYGKGWEFYSHEPIFWVKMFLLAVMGASSFFPTTKIIQRAIAKRNSGEFSPMSVKLAERMVKIVNGELLALASIPLAATLMSRGVAYADWFQWQIGAVPVGLALFGLGAKYVKEALDWKEEV